MAMAALPHKRKRVVLTLGTKLEIVRTLEKGNSQIVVGEKFGDANSTIADIWKDCKKISDSLTASESPAYAKKRCIVRHAKFDLVDEACWKWFCQQRSKGAPVSCVLLRIKARLFYTKLYPDADPEGFKDSMGWLSKFSQHHGIKSIQLQGEILSADASAVGPF